MRRTIRAMILAGVGCAAGVSAQAFTLENGTIWPLSVSIGGAPPQTVPAEEVAFLFRGQCANGCTVNVAVVDPLRAQTVISAVGGEVPVIQGNGDPVTVRVRMGRGGTVMTVEIVGDLATAVPTTSVSAPFSGSPSTTLPATTPATTPPSTTPPTLTAPPSATAAPSTPQQAPSAPPGFLPPPPPPDY